MVDYDKVVWKIALRKAAAEYINDSDGFNQVRLSINVAADIIGTTPESVSKIVEDFMPRARRVVAFGESN